MNRVAYNAMLACHGTHTYIHKWINPAVHTAFAHSRHARYRLINVGGNGHAVNHAIDPHGRPLNCTKQKGCFIVERNSSGFMQIDPARFPGPGSNETCLNDDALVACIAAKSGGDTGDGPNVDPADCGCANGNEGMRRLANDLRAAGFSWGSYNAMNGCENSECNTPELATARAQGFVLQDYALMVGEWGSEYIMVDSVGDREPQPNQRVNGSQGKFILDEWSRLIAAKRSGPPVILHSCHVACSANYFSGPTLTTAPCNESDPRQQFELADGPSGRDFLSDAGTGLCAGCLHVNTGCGNTALTVHNASGLGLGMQGCVNSSSQTMFWFDPGADGAGPIRHGAAISSATCLGLAGGVGPQVVEESPPSCINTTAQKWIRGPLLPGPAWRPPRTLLQSVGRRGTCLSSATIGIMPPDPWCTQTVNMWRSNTDSLPVWGRMMDELESLVGLGRVSQPGSWGFPDYLQVGVPMVGSLTWEESKSILAIWATCSSPLILSNDVRPGRMQQRVLDLFLNPHMLGVNQQYNGFAGDRVWTAPYGQVTSPLHIARTHTLTFCFVSALYR